MPDPNTITLVLKGLLCIFVNPGKTECTVGVLGSPPPRHDLKIIFRKQPAGGTLTEFTRLERPKIKNRLRLDVQNTSQTAITFRKPNVNINRQVDPTAANRDSFRWVVDLENSELYDGAIGAVKSGFDPLITFNNGELFTRQVSQDHLFIQRGIFNNEDFGFVAVEIGASFSLDQVTSKATFFNGGDTIFETEANTNYEIVVDHDAATHSGIVTDANHYYKAVAKTIPEQSRILFMSFANSGGGPAGPEAACFSAFLRTSQPQ